MIQALQNFFSETLWNFSLEEKPKLKRTCFKWLRIFVLALRSFFEKQSPSGASSLTYFTLMSVVPLLALFIAVAKSLGYHDLFQDQLLSRFSDQKEAFSQMFQYANAFLLEVEGGVVAAVGLSILFLSVLFLLYDLEMIFNQIWRVDEPRSYPRMFVDYLALLIIAPFFFILASSMTVFVVEYLAHFTLLLPIEKSGIRLLLFFINLLPYGLFGILFTFLYAFIPNTKVWFRSALLGGFVTACLYVLTQWAYIYFQIGVGRYGAVYGTMAALPLFLFWIQISWYLVLFGAQLSWAYQNFLDYEFEGPIQRVGQKTKKLVALWLMHFALKKKSISLKDPFPFPRNLAKIILKELVRSHILHEEEGCFFPDEKAFSMKITDLLEALDREQKTYLIHEEDKAFFNFQSRLQAILSAIENHPENGLIKDVPDTI